MDWSAFPDADLIPSSVYSFVRVFVDETFSTNYTDVFEDSNDYDTVLDRGANRSFHHDGHDAAEHEDSSDDQGEDGGMSVDAMGDSAPKRGRGRPRGVKDSKPRKKKTKVSRPEDLLS
eukprot:3354214-Rhodomonas_salina.1